MTKVYIINNDYYNNVKNSYIPEKILNRVKQYKIEKDYQNSFVAWYSLYNILKDEYNIDLEIINIYYNEYNKPYIDNIYFNISHSENLIVLCIADNECGIDIEMVNLNKDITLLKKKLFTSTETLLKNTTEYFFQKWTKTEAVFKAFGSGIIYSKINKIDLSNVYTMDLFDKQQNKYYLSVKTNDINEIIISKYK